MSGGAAHEVCKPLVRHFTLVLTNGATLKMPIVTKGTHARVAVNDIFNNMHWKHNIKTEATIAAEQNVLPDLTDFYARFGTKKGGAK